MFRATLAAPMNPRQRFARLGQVTKPGPLTKHVPTHPPEQGSHLEGNHHAARGLHIATRTATSAVLVQIHLGRQLQTRHPSRFHRQSNASLS
ncbi:hypothetical protein P3342_010940 [Pyrenophora teres f. teres]|nr:hypothetical protein P3342_010940 [Pyrenophora teres f. teres]